MRSIRSVSLRRNLSGKRIVVEDDAEFEFDVAGMAGLSRNSRMRSAKLGRSARDGDDPDDEREKDMDGRDIDSGLHLGGTAGGMAR